MNKKKRKKKKSKQTKPNPNNKNKQTKKPVWQHRRETAEDDLWPPHTRKHTHVQAHTLTNPKGAVTQVSAGRQELKPPVGFGRGKACQLAAMCIFPDDVSVLHPVFEQSITLGKK